MEPAALALASSAVAGWEVPTVLVQSWLVVRPGAADRAHLLHCDLRRLDRGAAAGTDWEWADWALLAVVAPQLQALARARAGATTSAPTSAPTGRGLECAPRMSRASTCPVHSSAPSTLHVSHTVNRSGVPQGCKAPRGWRVRSRGWRVTYAQVVGRSRVEAHTGMSCIGNPPLVRHIHLNVALPDR